MAEFEPEDPRSSVVQPQEGGNQTRTDSQADQVEVNEPDDENPLTTRQLVSRLAMAVVAAATLAGAYVYNRTQVARTEYNEWDLGGYMRSDEYGAVCVANCYREWREQKGYFNIHDQLVDGRLRESNGLDLSGHFEKGKLEGPNGVMIDPNVTLSKAIFESQRAIEERGPFHEGKLHGHNAMSRRRDGTVVKGDFLWGMPNGHDEIEFPDHSKLVGEFNNPKQEGPNAMEALRNGILVKPGDSMKITFNSGPDEGLVKGKKTDPKGNVVFDGAFSAEGFTGYEKVTLYNLGVYEGQLKDDVPNGLGKFTKEDGTVLKGNFVEGCLREHDLVLDLKIGSVYFGDIQNNKPYGNGQRVDGSGVWKGVFENGVFKTGENTFDDKKFVGEFFPAGGLKKGHAYYGTKSSPGYDSIHSVVETDIEDGFANGPGVIMDSYDRWRQFKGQFLGGKFTYDDKEEGAREDQRDQLMREHIRRVEGY